MNLTNVIQRTLRVVQSPRISEFAEIIYKIFSFLLNKQQTIVERKLFNSSKVSKFLFEYAKATTRDFGKTHFCVRSAAIVEAGEKSTRFFFSSFYVRWTTTMYALIGFKKM